MKGIKAHAVVTSRHALVQAQTLRFTSSPSSSMCADPAITGLDLTLQLPLSLLQPLPYSLFSSLPFLLFFCIHLSFPFFLNYVPSWTRMVPLSTAGLFPVLFLKLGTTRQVSVPLAGSLTWIREKHGASWLCTDEADELWGNFYDQCPFLHLYMHTHSHGLSLSLPLFTKCQTAIGVSYFCTVTEDM